MSGLGAGAAAAHAGVHRCPACAGALAPAAEGLACVACARTYAVADGIARLGGEAAATPGFDASYFDLLARVEDEQFWFVSRRAVILDALRRHVPDLAERPLYDVCLLYTSPSPRDLSTSRMPSSA